MMERVRYGEGIEFRALRFALLRNLAKTSGDLVDIRSGVHLFGMENLEVGERVSIHSMCYIDATGGLQIGSDVSIAHGSTIMTSTHDHASLVRPIRDQGLTFKAVRICDDVWIGAGSRILAGVTIGSHAIVGANSVVTSSIPPYAIAVGNPARVMKMRNDLGR